MNEAQFRQQMETACHAAEARLAEFFTQQGLQEAMRYSLMAGGKRIRPILTMQFCLAAGGTAEQGLDFGCGVEMLHTDSLIHDDLPCMDNDDLRRGKPTNHKVFGECVATLAGDALQAAAFSTVLHAAALPEARAQAAEILADAAGEQGMCGGQYLDTIGDGKSHTAEELTQINDKKTGALLRAACMMGVAAAPLAADAKQNCIAAARDYATALGLAFQIRDDILDATSTTETLGKPIGSDASNGKTTYVTLLGAEECEKRVLEYTEQAKQALQRAAWPGGTDFLCALADKLARRDH